jgi:hypothetical protein
MTPIDPSEKLHETARRVPRYYFLCAGKGEKSRITVP